MIMLDDARRIIAACETKAAEIGQPMNVAVADAGKNTGLMGLAKTRPMGRLVFWQEPA